MKQEVKSMNKKNNEELQALVDKATVGDKKSLETLIEGVQDLVFNLSLRMLGTFADAEDATQDILLKMITHLSSFRGESSFTTWVFGIAVNHPHKTQSLKDSGQTYAFCNFSDDWPQYGIPMS